MSARRPPPPEIFEAVIGLEIHAQLLTRSKMFCACPVVDLTEAAPNSAVCSVCSGLPGTLPVINEKVVEYALRVALALDCEINSTSIFARKNYFYPDLPKGYQISQYEQPLAENGRLTIRTTKGERDIRIRRVHLEEDTGKLTHLDGTPVGEDALTAVPGPDSAEEAVAEEEPGIPPESAGVQPDPEGLAAEQPARSPNRQKRSLAETITCRGDHRPFAHSLVDLNRAGVPLLEIVTEPDLHTPEEVGAYARALRLLLQYLEVNTGDMQKGVLRIEPNISVRRKGDAALGTRTEVKNLNSFRALERAVAFEIERQVELLQRGETVLQETAGWDEAAQRTVPQRSKEEADDYRYFPEPDLPPLVIPPGTVEAIRTSLPEIPHERFKRFQRRYGLSAYDAEVLTATRHVADFFERTAAAAPGAGAKQVANWISGDLFSILNQAGKSIEGSGLSPEGLAGLLGLLSRGDVNAASARQVLEAMVETGSPAGEVVEALGLGQVSDRETIDDWVRLVLEDNPAAVQDYRDGKKGLANWLFGQVMRQAGGRANPAVVKERLETRLRDIMEGQGKAP